MPRSYTPPAPPFDNWMDAMRGQIIAGAFLREFYEFHRLRGEYPAGDQLVAILEEAYSVADSFEAASGALAAKPDDEGKV